MTKLLMIIVAFFCLGRTYPQAQAFYRSKDFEQKGVTEYIKIMWAKSVYYWTSANKKDLLLINRKKTITPVKTGYYYEVSFPNSKAVYKLNEIYGKNRKLICTHPDGRTQVFEALPTIFRSKDFEKTGVTEYLTYDIEQETYLYFTSKNGRNRIKLMRAKEDDYLLYKFPGGRGIYRIEVEGVCLGGIRCTHPDGRMQYFEFYQWKD